MLTKEQAIRFVESGAWRDMTPRARAEFQLYVERSCMPLDVFCAALEEVLGRPVLTTEFAFVDHLRRELRGDKPAPSREEIFALIPEDKRAFVLTG